MSGMLAVAVLRDRGEADFPDGTLVSVQYVHPAAYDDVAPYVRHNVARMVTAAAAEHGHTITPADVTTCHVTPEDLRAAWEAHGLPAEPEPGEWHTIVGCWTPPTTDPGAEPAETTGAAL